MEKSVYYILLSSWVSNRKTQALSNIVSRYSRTLVEFDEWCKRMYDAITADVEKYQRKYDESKKLEKHEDS